MSVYGLMNEAIYCGDFLEYAQKLNVFCEAALKEKNRAAYVNVFYERLREYGLADCAFRRSYDENDKRYIIYEGNQAVSTFMAICMPRQETPTKSLHNLQSFAERMLHEFVPPIGQHIGIDSLVAIMEYLEQQYRFSETVFSDRKAVFSVLDVSNTVFNSQCLVLGGANAVVQHFFLYCMNHPGEDGISPEAVLFHELGHAIHDRYCGNADAVPQNVLDYLQGLCMPKIHEITASQQSEVFADVLSIGLMYDSPFARFDPFTYMHPDDKKAFKQLTETILSGCEPSASPDEFHIRPLPAGMGGAK